MNNGTQKSVKILAESKWNSKKIKVGKNGNESKLESLLF